MDNSVDWSLFYKLDQGLLLDVISSAAHVACEQDIISSSDTDDLRISIRTLQLQASDDRQFSLVSGLHYQGNRFVKLLLSRYGSVGFSLNLGRLSLKGQINDLQNALFELGNQLLIKSQQMLNRNIYVYSGGVCQRQVLLSALLIDICESINQSSVDFAKINSLLSVMLPSDVNPYSESDRVFDTNVAKAIGFDSVIYEPTPFRTERRVSQLISNILLNVTDQISAFVQICQSNHLKIVRPTVGPACAWLRAEAFRFSSLSFPDTEDFESWELRRQNFNTSLKVICHSIEKLLTDLTVEMSTGSVGMVRQEFISRAVVRAVVSDLIVKGHGVHDAEVAGDTLWRYCCEKKVAPHLVLEAEFPHIHPLLTKDCVAKTSSAAEQSGASLMANSEKSRVYNEISRLGVEIRKVLTQGLLLAMICFMIPSCGLKTDPKSNEIDLRPQLPLKVTDKKLPAKVQ